MRKLTIPNTTRIMTFCLSNMLYFFFEMHFACIWVAVIMIQNVPDMYMFKPLNFWGQNFIFPNGSHPLQLYIILQSNILHLTLEINDHSVVVLFYNCWIVYLITYTQMCYSTLIELGGSSSSIFDFC